MKLLVSSLAFLFASAEVIAFADDASVRRAVDAFEEAEKLIGQNRIGEACAKYANSYALDPQLGALLHVADCSERAGNDGCTVRITGVSAT